YDIYDRPDTTFVAQLVGTPRINLLKAGRDGETLSVPDSTIRLSTPLGGKNIPSSFTLGVRPEDVKLDSGGTLTGAVALIEPLGVETMIHIKTGEQMLTSIIPGMTHHKIGDSVTFDISPNQLHYFDKAGKRITVN